MEVNIDFGALAQAIVNALITGLENLIAPLPQQFLNWLADQITNLWNDIWNSGANLLATPFELTLNYPPAQQLGIQVAVLVWAITSLSIVLLGLRHLWRSFAGGPGLIEDSANGFLMGVMLAGSATILVGQAYSLTFVASKAIGQINYAPSFGPRELLSLGSAFVVSVFTLLVMMIYGWKLLMRAAYRVVLLMFLTPFAPIAGILYGIPQTRWISTAYWITFGGWLAGGFLSIGAISLGVQIAGFSGGGILVLVFGIAMVQLAYDLLVILPRWAFGQISTPSISIPNVLATVAGAAAGGAVGGFAGGATGAAAGGGGSIAGALPAAGAIGQLVGPSLGPGYD